MSELKVGMWLCVVRRACCSGFTHDGLERGSTEFLEYPVLPDGLKLGAHEVKYYGEKEIRTIRDVREASIDGRRVRIETYYGAEISCEISDLAANQRFLVTELPFR